MKQRKDILADLIEGEEVMTRNTNSRGGPLYWTADNFQKYLKQVEK